MIWFLVRALCTWPPLCAQRVGDDDLLNDKYTVIERERETRRLAWNSGILLPLHGPPRPPWPEGSVGVYWVSLAMCCVAYPVTPALLRQEDGKLQARCQKGIWHRADCCLKTQTQAGVAATGKGFRDSMEWN